MAQYLKLFKTEADYEAVVGTENEPEVAHIIDDVVIKEKRPETRLVLTFNITDTSSPTRILYNGIWGDKSSAYTSVEVDGVKQSTVTTGYTFNTTGKHIVKYGLLDPAKIENVSFSGCSNVIDAKIPDSVETIGYSAFTYCSLTSVTFTEGSHLNKIDTGAFGQCTGITSVGKFGDGSTVELPGTLTTFGAYPFGYNNSLRTMTIQESVTKMGSTFFYECHSLQSVTVEAIAPPSLGRDMLYLSNRSAPIYVPADSVAAYKAAAGWKQYPSNIRAIQ